MQDAGRRLQSVLDSPHLHRAPREAGLAYAGAASSCARQCLRSQLMMRRRSVCVLRVWKPSFPRFQRFWAAGAGPGVRDLGTTIFSRTLSIHSKTARILCMFGQKFAKLSMVRRRGIFARLARKLRHGIFFHFAGRQNSAVNPADGRIGSMLPRRIVALPVLKSYCCKPKYRQFLWFIILSISTSRVTLKRL